jgi:hypothetical protein
MPLSREQLVTGGWYDNAGRKDKYARCRYEVMSLCNLLHEYHDIGWRTKLQYYSFSSLKICGAAGGVLMVYYSLCWVLSAMADNRGCAKLGRFHSYCTFPEFNTALEIMEIFREMYFYVELIITILNVFKVRHESTKINIC